MCAEGDGDAGRWGTREWWLDVKGLQESRTVMEESNKGKMKGCEGEGACLAICPVVKAPSGRGEKVAPRLAQHMNMNTYVTHAHECTCTQRRWIQKGSTQYAHANTETKACKNGSPMSPGY